ncbi:MAG: tRNA preQ1(34) S-adenosylmethionine ribosyltransferase-isomerase QueA [Candidatus Nomurabacteria bacterium]|jgi:S-adenosylmethionine:tRNA ribosyltransferase-isomerase|nr:tRNA preQ1(34) S-adenosylmethionine ribosyltransferase-isomerase QueA [Candidatus Nomurabacteria bacterium]
MKSSEYNYELPEGLIAKFPPVERGASRLLVVERENGDLRDAKYADLAELLREGDVLILNDTKVLPMRLILTKENGARREIILLEKHAENDWRRHKILHHGKLSVGDKLFLGEEVVARVEAVLGGGVAEIASVGKRDLLEIANDFGEVPLPPYLNREATDGDKERYQTVFARNDGSAAAPTASLNFTDEVRDKLLARGVRLGYLTLHVGLGTFLPIRTDEIGEHKMHKEYFEIPAVTAELIRATKARGGLVIALGTTVARTLEYAGDFLSDATVQVFDDFCGEADIFIYPGYEFKVIDGLLTNFHAPKSTVLMLAGAFAGWDLLMEAYEHATSEKYNFLSYGDSMLIV